MSDNLPAEDDFTNVFSVDPYGDFTFSTCVVGGGWMPTCTILQGVPKAHRTTHAEEMYPQAASIFVTKQSAALIIAGLQKWLRDKEAYDAHPVLALDAGSTEGAT